MAGGPTCEIAGENRIAFGQPENGLADETAMARLTCSL